MKTRQSNSENFTRRNKANERGEGLLPVLLAVAITAMVAAGVSSVVIGARDKSVASQLCNVVRQVQDAKQRYLLDNPTVSETTQTTFANLQPYLTAMGLNVTTENQLLAGTGRTITNYGTFATGVTIDQHVDLTHISADMQPIVQMITFADAGGNNNAAPGG